VDHPAEAIGDTRRVLCDPGRIANQYSVYTPDGILSILIRKVARIKHDVSYSMATHGLSKATTTAFLLTFDQKDQVKGQCPAIQELRCCTGYGENRTFVIRYPAAVQITIATRERERVGIPSISRRRDNVIVAAWNVNNAQRRPKIPARTRRIGPLVLHDPPRHL
jgi:hypothetical protein